MSQRLEIRAGDRVLLDGVLDENLSDPDAAQLPDSFWVGATAVLVVWDPKTDAVALAAGVAVLDTTVTPKLVSYDGPAFDSVGDSEYQLKWVVTGAGGKQQTWPNHRSGKITLRVLAPLA